jgi:hypothetical protein
MVKGEATNKILTLVFAIVIIIAAITLIYVNLPEEGTKEETDKTNDEVNTTKVLSFSYKDEQINYTLPDLEDLEEYTASGSYIKTGWLPTVVINGPYNYTGVRFTTLINQFNNLPDNYNITVESSDEWISTYTYNETQGNVEIYNDTGNITGVGGATMLLAYKEDGEYLTNETDGPLRIVFVGENTITSSKLWAKWVISIEIIEPE